MRRPSQKKVRKIDKYFVLNHFYYAFYYKIIVKVSFCCSLCMISSIIIMMRIFRTKTQNTKRLADAQIAGAEAPAAGTGSSLSAPATFCNPFGLGQSESLVQPTVGDSAEAVRKEIGMP